MLVKTEKRCCGALAVLACRLDFQLPLSGWAGDSRDVVERLHLHAQIRRTLLVNRVILSQSFVEMTFWAG